MIQEAFASKNAYTDTLVLGLRSDVTGSGKPYICFPDKSQKHLIVCIGQSITKL